MMIEIFEAQGYGLPTDIDVLLLNLKKKYAQDLGVRKIDISQKDEIKKHKDVIEALKNEGMDILPVIKLDGKIVEQGKIETLLYKRLG
jgi:disulfide oxidoreductase YuzD